MGTLIVILDANRIEKNIFIYLFFTSTKELKDYAHSPQESLRSLGYFTQVLTITYSKIHILL